MRRLYWGFRWRIWEARERLFVRLASQQLRNNAIVFIHPRDGGLPRAFLARIEDPWRNNFDMTVEPHSHVEGGKPDAS